jgi:glycosyltransferase involved in cell wall biosynthesis
MPGKFIQVSFYLNTKIKIFLERFSLKLANFIITPSLTLKNGIVERYGLVSKKIHVVPNGVNEKLFYPSLKNCSLRENFGIENNDFIAGFVGSMGKWQGLNILKDAIIRVINSDNKIKFLLVGDYTEDSNHVKMKAGSGDAAKNNLSFIKDNFLEKRVIYHGFVNYEATADFMNICDVLLAPYTSEYCVFGGGSPMKLYAYLGCAKPVIISDLGELTDSIALRKNDAAYLIPPDDSSALAKAILFFKGNESAIRKYGKRGRTFVLNERRWSDSCSKILSILAV